LQSTLDEWLVKRARAHRTLVDWLDSTEYADFVTSFMQFCQTPRAGAIDTDLAPGEELSPTQVRHVVPSMLLANFENVRCCEALFDRQEDVPLAILHQLRIACKYLRYNLEFITGLLGPESPGIIAQLKKLQDDLGDLNDAVVSKQLLTEVSSNDAIATVGRYQTLQDKLIAKLRKQTSADFAQFVGPDNRRCLFAAIAEL
jgi:CHAD domain-containing protein